MFSTQPSCPVTESYTKVSEEAIHPKETNEDKNSLRCNICGLIISNKWNFTLHMRVHNNDRRYKCTHCSSSFITSYDLKRHTLTHEGNKPKFKCQFCPKTYASRHSRYLHEDSHDQSEYKCRHCPEIFSKFIYRKEHEKECHSNDTIYFNCSKCTKKFTSRHFLENHEKTYHKKEENGFKCEECGILLETSVQLNIHRRSHINKTIIISETDPSGAPSNKVKTLKKKVPIELFGIRIHECIICTKRYTSRGEMLSHMASSHPEENKAIFKFTCHICKKSFNCKQGLAQHSITHTGEKKYACDLCDYKSKRSADLKVHKRKHTGEAPYVCDKCGRRFQQVRSLQHHKKQHFGKIFKCDLCSASFYRNRELDWHKQKHTLGGFKCSKCEKLLSNPYSLKSHIRLGNCKKKEDSNCIIKSKKKLNNIYKVDLGNSKFYECFACGFITQSILDIIKHQVIHKAKKRKLDNNDMHKLENDKAVSKEIDQVSLVFYEKAEKTDYKGVIKPFHHSHQPSINRFLPLASTSSSILFSTIEVPDSISVISSSPLQHPIHDKIPPICVNGRTFFALDDLKKLDTHSLIEYVKNCS